MAAEGPPGGQGGGAEEIVVDAGAAGEEVAAVGAGDALDGGGFADELLEVAGAGGDLEFALAEQELEVGEELVFGDVVTALGGVGFGTGGDDDGIESDVGEMGFAEIVDEDVVGGGIDAEVEAELLEFGVLAELAQIGDEVGVRDAEGELLEPTHGETGFVAVAVVIGVVAFPNG
jgi:hypothetical protein